jgi:ABC-2 type transport system permease protein
MLRVFDTYSGFTSGVWQRKMQYRSRFFLFTLSVFLHILIPYFLWRALFAAAPSSVLHDYTFPQIVTYVCLGVTIVTFVHGPSGGFFTERIRDGSIVFDLARPIDIQASMLAEHIGNVSSSFIIALPALVFLTVVLGVGRPASWLGLLGFLVSLILSILIGFFFDYTVSLLAFYTTSASGIYQAKWTFVTFLAGGYMPPAFFPGWLEALGRFLPFREMIASPISIYLGQKTGSNLLVALGQQALWVIILLLVGRLLYKMAVRQIIVQGG